MHLKKIIFFMKAYIPRTDQEITLLSQGDNILSLFTLNLYKKNYNKLNKKCTNTSKPYHHDISK